MLCRYCNDKHAVNDQFGLCSDCYSLLPSMYKEYNKDHFMYDRDIKNLLYWQNTTGMNNNEVFRATFNYNNIWLDEEHWLMAITDSSNIDDYGKIKSFCPDIFNFSTLAFCGVARSNDDRGLVMTVINNIFPPVYTLKDNTFEKGKNNYYSEPIVPHIYIKLSIPKDRKPAVFTSVGWTPADIVSIMGLDAEARSLGLRIVFAINLHSKDSKIASFEEMFGTSLGQQYFPDSYLDIKLSRYSVKKDREISITPELSAAAGMLALDFFTYSETELAESYYNHNVYITNQLKDVNNDFDVESYIKELNHAYLILSGVA